MRAHVRIWPARGEIAVLVEHDERIHRGTAVVSAGQVSQDELTEASRTLRQDAQRLNELLQLAGVELGALEEWN